jgi:hypothetical protein
MPTELTPPTYLARYHAGEHAQVWAELQALGAGVRAEPIYGDARAVARETMRRVRRDIALLLARLDALGYAFYADPAAYTEAPWGTPGTRDYPPRLAAPDADAEGRLDEIERDLGPFPLALRAFYAVVGAVNLLGEPARAPAVGADVDNSAISEGAGAAPGWRSGTELDPLFIYGLRTTYAAWRGLREAGAEERARYCPLLFPDFLGKYGLAGVGPVQVEFPGAGMDGRLWFEDGALPGPQGGDFLFVEYLRYTLLRRGGFAGLGMPEYPDESPLAEPLLSRLTQRLLPF